MTVIHSESNEWVNEINAENLSIKGRFLNISKHFSIPTFGRVKKRKTYKGRARYTINHHHHSCLKNIYIQREKCMDLKIELMFLKKNLSYFNQLKLNFIFKETEKHQQNKKEEKLFYSFKGVTICYCCLLKRLLRKFQNFFLQ